MNRSEKYTLVTKPRCPNCLIAKRFLDVNGLLYDLISLDSPELIASFKEQYPTVRMVPVIIREDGSLYTDWIIPNEHNKI